jgi:biopolymer transport protein TolR
MEDRERQKKKQMSSINVVPYVDVMLVLLVIFMVTTPLLQQHKKVDLPRTTTQSKTERDVKKHIVVTVDEHGNVYMNFGKDPLKKLSHPELEKRARELVKKSPDSEVSIRGDRATKYKYIVASLAVLQSAGVKKVELVTIFENKAK